MNSNPLWANEALAQTVINMMDSKTPVADVISAIVAQFGVELQGSQITSKYYRYRQANGLKSVRAASVYDAEIPGVQDMVDGGLLAAEIGARIGKDAAFVRRYCVRHGLTIAQDPNSSTMRLARSRALRLKSLTGGVEPGVALPGVKFAERGTTCVWPMWTGRVSFEEKNVCGCEVVSVGKSYCAAHSRLAYATGSARKDAIASMKAAGASNEDK